MVAEATALGAPTELAPSPAATQFVAAVRQASTATPALAAAREMALDLDRLQAIPRRKLAKADPSVRAAADRARQLPTDSAAATAEKLARHAVLLRRFDRLDVAHDAALAAGRVYEELAPEDRSAGDDGCCAYCLLILADGWFYGGEIEVAESLAEQSVALFTRYLQLLTPPNMFDLVRALTILAQCQQHSGRMDEARQSIVDAKAIADATDRTVPGTPGSIPHVPWGLPLVPTEEEVAALYG